MRKVMVTLMFLTLICAGVYAANLTIRAFDVVTLEELDWNIGTGAEIYLTAYLPGIKHPMNLLIINLVTIVFREPDI